MRAEEFEIARRRMLAEISARAVQLRETTGRAAFDERVMAAMRRVPRHEFVPIEFQPFAYANIPQWSAYKRGRGRGKGEQGPNDWSDDELDVLPYAIEDVIRIRAIWKRRLGGQNRGDSDPPTAIGIAARRHGLTEERRRVLLKNRSRRYRGI